MALSHRHPITANRRPCFRPLVSSNNNHGSLGRCRRWRYGIFLAHNGALLHAAHRNATKSTALTYTPESITHSSNRTDSTPPDLRILHYNDVYHVEPGSREPVGGIARFQTLCNSYASSSEEYAGQPELVTLFSGDAFNPSLESSVTKGMVS